MPIYEYQCQACQHQFEKIQKFSDDPLTICPECQEPALVKLLSTPGFRLKGSGWYETDFKTGNKRNLAESESRSDSSDKKSEPKSDKGSESKNLADSGGTPAASSLASTTKASSATH